MTSKEYLDLGIKGLEKLSSHLGLANHPTGTESDLDADDYAFGCLVAIGNALDKYSKDLKVLEIIAETGITRTEIAMIKTADYKGYTEMCKDMRILCRSKYVYDLLREWLKGDKQ